MSNGYGSSSDSSNRTSGQSNQRRTNPQGRVAPEGFHYMPDGTLMSDAEHTKLYGDSPDDSTVDTSEQLQDQSFTYNCVRTKGVDATYLHECVEVNFPLYGSYKTLNDCLAECGKDNNIDPEAFGGALYYRK